MALGGVIFDWDGVVINSASLHEKSWEMLANELALINGNRRAAKPTRG